MTERRPPLGAVTDGEVIERVVAIPAGHPCLPGHFPGRPIVPAVLILDEVRAVAADVFDNRWLAAIDRCKFLDFVLPAQSFKIALTCADGAIVDFACSTIDDGRPLAKGCLRFEPSTAVT